MKRIGFFLFFCILSLYGLAQAENDKDTLIIRQDKINEFINEMNEVDISMDFINEPPTLTPTVLSDTLRMPKFDLTPREEIARGRLLTAGPGRLTMAMGIDKSFYGADLVHGSVYIEDGKEKAQVERSKRINIDYARYGKNFPWRFTMKGSLWISK